MTFSCRLSVWRWGMSIDKNATAAVTVDFQIRVNENPNVQTTGYLRKWDDSLQSTGTNSKSITFHMPIVFPGPCIIKVQAVGSAADIDGQSGFELELVKIT